MPHYAVNTAVYLTQDDPPLKQDTPGCVQDTVATQFRDDRIGKGKLRRFTITHDDPRVCRYYSPSPMGFSELPIVRNGIF